MGIAEFILSIGEGLNPSYEIYANMHYFEDTQNRERNVTRDIAHTYLSTVCKDLELNGKVIPEFEVPKSIYGAKGDVDLLLCYEAYATSELLMVACEIKTIYLTKDGELKSAKKEKAKTKVQLDNLQKDGFDYVWLLEFIVTEPADSWLHPQAGDALFMETVTVENPNFGHAKFQIDAVAKKPEAEGGSIARRVVKKAHRLPLNDNPGRLIKAILTIENSKKDN